MTARQQFIATLLLGVAFLILFRQLEPSNYQIGLMMRCMILMIVTIGLNILIGHAGLVSLGQAALYGLGAYVAAWLAVKQGVQFLPAVIAGVVVTGLFGAALAYPTVRVRGVYLAVITIAFGLVFQNILVEWLPVTGGTQGLIGIPRGNVFGVSLTRPIYFSVVAGCLIIAFIIQYNVIHSRYGRAMRATAQSENAAKALGINLAATRTLAFVISAALAGISGALIAQTAQFVGLGALGLERSGTVLIMLIIGGVGQLYGAFIGVTLYMIAQDRFSTIDPVYWYFWIGLVMIFVVIFARGGVLGLIGRARQRIGKPS